MPLSLLDLALAMAVVFVAATLQGLIGIGFNVLAVPILLLIDPILAPVPNLLLAVPLTLLQLFRERGDIDRSGVGWILLGRIPGGLAGLGLLLMLSARGLDITLALLLLGIVALLGSGVSIRRTPATEFTTGVVSGIAGIVGAVGGPPVGLLYKDAPPRTVRSTLGVIFALGLVISIGLRIVGGRISWTDVQVTAWLLPAMALGFATSTRFKDRVNTSMIRRGILTVSALASLSVLIRTLAG